MITDNLIPSPFTLKIEIHRLEIGWLVEVEARTQTGYAPALRRFAVGTLAAVDAVIDPEIGRFLAAIDNATSMCAEP